MSELRNRTMKPLREGADSAVVQLLEWLLFNRAADVHRLRHPRRCEVKIEELSLGRGVFVAELQGIRRWEQKLPLGGLCRRCRLNDRCRVW
jgi:hypothetical protein